MHMLHVSFHSIHLMCITHGVLHTVDRRYRSEFKGTRITHLGLFVSLNLILFPESKTHTLLFSFVGKMKFQDIQKGFQQYIMETPDSDLVRLRKCGFWNIRNYLPFGVNTALLRAATQFWDTDLNLFRFRHEELCPMVEEFSAFMGIQHTRNTLIALPTDSPRLYDDVRREFPLRERDHKRIFQKQGADLQEAFKVIRHIGPKERGWVPLMRLMILGCFLCE